MELKDDGIRHEFGTGAVREIINGKGRCDLLPLNVIAKFIDLKSEEDDIFILSKIENYINYGNIDSLYSAVKRFIKYHYNDPEDAMLELSKHFEDGARKYSDNNWKKGINLHCYIDSAIRHYLKYLRGDSDEPHDRAFVWNLVCCIWTHENKPEMKDFEWLVKIKVPD